MAEPESQQEFFPLLPSHDARLIGRKSKCSLASLSLFSASIFSLSVLFRCIRSFLPLIPASHVCEWVMSCTNFCFTLRESMIKSNARIGEHIWSRGSDGGKRHQILSAAFNDRHDLRAGLQLLYRFLSLHLLSFFCSPCCGIHRPGSVWQMAMVGEKGMNSKELPVVKNRGNQSQMSRCISGSTR